MKYTFYFFLLLCCIYTSDLHAQQPIVLTKKYGKIEPFQDGFAKVKIDGLWGLIDKQGKEVVPCIYQEVRGFAEGLARVQREDKWGFIDRSGKEVISCQYQEASFFNNGLALITQEGKFGFIDKTGKMIIPCKYESIDIDSSTFKTFEHNNIQAVQYQGLWGVIDKTSKEIVSCKYQRVGGFIGDYALIMQNNLRGIVDKNGKEVVSCKYQTFLVENQEVLFNSEGLQKAVRNSLYGYVDKTGKEVIPCKYQSVGFFHEGLASVKQNNQYGFIDKVGKIIIPCKYQSVGIFQEGLAAVKQNDLWGFIDKAGKMIIPCKYQGLGNFQEGLAAVTQNDLWGFIDKTAKMIIPCKYQGVNHFKEGLAPVKQNDLWGIINKEGKEIVSYKYDNFMAYRDNESLFEYEGLQIVEQKGLLGIIDITGKEIVVCKYQKIGFLREGLIVIIENNKAGIIDKDGKELIPPKYQYIIDTFSQGFCKIKYENHYGFIDRNAKEAILPTYTYLESFSDSIAIGKKNYDSTFVLEGIKLNAEVEKWVLVPLPLPEKICKKIAWHTPHIAAEGGENKDEPYRSSRDTLTVILDYEANVPLVSREFQLYRDGELVPARANTKPITKGKSYQTTLYLEKGLHQYEVVAYDRHSLPIWIDYAPLLSPIKKPSLHLLAVGYNYQDKHDITPLQYAEADAREFVRTFAAMQGKLYENVYVDTLIGNSASVVNIKGLLEQLLNHYQGKDPDVKIDSQDVIMLYFSGHGEVLNNVPMYFSADFKSAIVGATSVSMTEIYKYIEPIYCKRLLFSDFCKSGNQNLSGAVVSKQGLAIQDSMYLATIKQIAKTEAGLLTYSSCVRTQLSYESTHYGHGIFTQAILEATREGKAFNPSSNSFQVLTIKDLETYINKRVPKLLKEANIGSQQTPEIINKTLELSLPIYVR